MFEKDGRIGFVASDADKSQQAVEFAEKILAWVRNNAEIIHAIPHTDIPPEARELGKIVHPSIMDTFAAASGSGRVLLSEDRRLRWLGGILGIKDSAWLQPALLVCLSKKKITPTAYADAILNLSLWGHALTSLDGAALLRATGSRGERSLDYFSQVAEKLASPRLDVNSLLKVVSSFLMQLWIQRRSRVTKEKLTAIAFSACRRSHPNSPTVLTKFFEEFLNRASKRIPDGDAQCFKQATRYMRQWLIENPL
jgi:hypothetical protein